MKNVTKAFVLILAVCSILAGCSTTKPADSAYVVVPVVPAAPAASATPAAAVTPEETAPADPMKLETNGITQDYSVNAMGLDFHIFTLSPTQIAMKYPSDVKLEEMLPAAEDFASRYVELLKDAVLTIDEENSTAVLTFPKEAKSFDIKAFEAALADSIPAYVSAYAAANPRPVEPADIKVPENKAVSAIPAAPAAPASTPAATPAAPAKSASPAPVAAEQTAAVPAKSNAGTIILVVVISIIVIACIVYFVNRRKEK